MLIALSFRASSRRLMFRLDGSGGIRQVDDSPPDRTDRRLGPVCYTQSFQDNINMPLNGTFRNAQRRGDLAITHAANDQADNLKFAGR